MKKLSLILILVMVSFANAQDKEYMFMLTGLWGGKLPCADCEYILYKLNIKRDNSYEEQYIYTGKNVEPYKTSGKWSYGDTILTLTGISGSVHKYELKGNKLLPLSADSNYIPNLEIVKLSRDIKESGTDKWNELRMKGIDFIARGNEPFWGIDYDKGGVLKFSRLDGGEIEFTNVKEVPIMDVAAVSYSAVTPKHEIRINMFREECIDNMSGEVFTHRVTVQYRPGKSNKYVKYEGCGKYLSDTLLYGSWNLTKMNGKEFTLGITDTYKQPTMSINTSTGRVNGNSGCNSYSGSVRIKDNTLTFGMLMSTEMACIDMSVERDFQSLLNNGIFTYKIEDSILKLSKNGVTVLEFSKAD